MALNDIKVPKENSSGTFDEIVLTGAELGLEKPATGNASSTQVVLGNDTRLSDSRTPTAHAASHTAGGSDPLFDQDLNTTDEVAFYGFRVGNVLFDASNADDPQSVFFPNSSGTIAFIDDIPSTFAASQLTSGTLAHERGGLEADVSAYNGLVKISGGSTSAVGIGTGSTEVAAGDHGHGNINSSGQVGTTANLPLKTGTGGIVEAGAFGTGAGEFAEGNHTHELTALAATGATNGHVLTANGSNGATFAALPASGVTGAASSASDVLGVSGSNITGVDANADRIVYWNNTSNKLAYGTPADAGAAASSHTHGTGDITGLSAIATSGSASDLTAGTVATARLGTGTANSGTFLRGDQTWAAVSGVTTGSVDNAVLRADGTGGSTSQSSDLNIEDATTSTQNNVAITNQHSGQTNSALVLQPKGTGALIAGARPTGAASTGNARGVAAIDLQMTRSAATQVASGDYAVIGGGRGNTASANDNVVCGGRNNTASSNFVDTFPAAVCGGYNNTASNFGCFVGGGVNNTASTNRASLCAGDGNTSSGYASFVGAGEANTANATYASVLGGNRSLADRHGLFANAAGMFAATGDAQRIRAVLRCKTTTNAAVEMALDGSTTYLTIPSGKVIFCNIKVVGSRSTGAEVATYERQYAVKNVAGTSSEVFAPVTIGTDNAAGTTLEVAVVDAGDYIRVRPTGVASQTWRWVASVDAVEVAYGT